MAPPGPRELMKDAVLTRPQRHACASGLDSSRPVGRTPGPQPAPWPARLNNGARTAIGPQSAPRGVFSGCADAFSATRDSRAGHGSDPSITRPRAQTARAASLRPPRASNKLVTRRHLNALILFLPVAAVRASGQPSVAGRLQAAGNGTVMLKTNGGKLIQLDGDTSTMAVLRDPRVIREQFEALGEWKSSGVFQIDPIHKKALFIRRGGKLLVITYWCAVCAIRTYAPGPCQCCQEETAFDPRDPSLENTAPSF